MTERPREIELKLRSDPAGLERLRECEIVRRHARSALRSHELVSTYFDTADGRLKARGLALRVRQDGARLIQTLKAANERDGAAADRAEWEVELPAAEPDLAAFGTPEPMELAGLDPADELGPVFVSRIHRDSILVEWPDGRDARALVEIAFDQGVIEAEGQDQSVAEIELELKEGDPQALFALAAALRAVCPVAIETCDKAARGYRLATGQGGAPSKARRLELSGDLAVEEGLARILRHHFRHWLDNEAPAALGSDPEGVHQLRVALRRLRSALAIFKSVLAPAARQHWATELRWLLQGLGTARDLDVLALELLPPLRQDPEAAAALRPLEALVAIEREKAQALVREVLASRRYADLGFEFAAWIERSGWREGLDVDRLIALRQPLNGLARSCLDAGYRRVRRRARRFGHLDADARHEVRIAVKKLRYGVEFFESLFRRKAARRFGKRLSSFQEALGQMNDVAAARRILGELAPTVPPAEREPVIWASGMVLGWYTARLGEWEPELARSWRHLKRTAPFWSEDG
jgi:inorganic triphosphatase YgiF